MSESADDSLPRHCEVCQQVAPRRCSGCKLVFYCGVEHKQEHWNEHKEVCKLFEVCQSDLLGRHVKARRDLNPGDVIFTETPIVFGPKPHRIQKGYFPCVGCCRLLGDQTCERCPGCLWPVCSVDCPGLKSPQIHGFECNILKLRPPSDSKSFYDCYRFDVLIILRCLYLKKANGEEWEALTNLQDHLKDRGPNTKVFKSIEEKCRLLQESYLQPLKTHEEEIGQSILPDVTNDLIHKICGILDVNAIDLSEEFDAFILYPTASLLEHNCTPNTVQIIDEKANFKLTLRAAVPIKKDEDISTIYTHILWGTSARRHHIKKTKYFVCTCRRCQDPTEMDTYVNALKCLGVGTEPCGGIQLPLSPTDGSTQWACNKCEIKLPNKGIMKFAHHLSSEVDKLMARHPKFEELEDILGKLLNFLHPNHYLIYSVKYTLVQLYSNEDVSDDVLNKKLQMCEDLIEITRKIDPGNSRLSMHLAVIFNEQFLAKFQILTRNFDSECKDKYSDAIKEIYDLTEKSKKFLDYEKDTTAGSKLFEVVCQNESKFTRWIEENGLQSVIFFS